MPIELLAALATKDGDRASHQAWTELGALVRQPLQRISNTHMPPMSTGEPEMAALESTPDDAAAAQRLSMAIALRAVVDAAFYNGLQTWQARIQATRTGSGDVRNTVGRSTIYGPAIQARDVSHVTVHTPAPPPGPSAKDRQQAEDRRRRAIRDAAYSRLLGRLPQPLFESVNWVQMGNKLWRWATYDNLKPERPAYWASPVDDMLKRIKELTDGKLEVPGVFSVTPTHQRFDNVAAYIASLRLERAQGGSDRYARLYSVTSVDQYLAEYRQCMSDYFEERDRA